MGLSGKCCSDDESYEESADEDGWGEPTGGMRALLQEITIAAKHKAEKTTNERTQPETRQHAHNTQM